jgi:hypothetical protein
MSNQKDGGPAFPTEGYLDGEKLSKGQGDAWENGSRGMTLRDWFAGHAMAGLPHMGCGADLDNKDFASAAYQIADAMISEREKRNGQ